MSNLKTVFNVHAKNPKKKLWLNTKYEIIFDVNGT